MNAACNFQLFKEKKFIWSIKTYKVPEIRTFIPEAISGILYKLKMVIFALKTSICFEQKEIIVWMKQKLLVGS